jgi:membrane-bound lytic murein transglycosylase D
MKRSGRTDFWSLASSSRYLPQETRDYVPLVLAAIIVARNPAQYGLSVEPSALPPYERVVVPGAVDLRRIAEWVEVPVQLLQDLNPELRRWMTPLRTSDYELKVPDGTAEIVRARLLDASTDARASLTYYTVKKGQTMQSIAKALKVSRTDLAEANYLSSRARLQIGQQLIVPRAPTLLLAGGAEVPASSSTPVVDVPVPAVAAVERAPRDVTPPAKLTHRVRQGDTLFSIARRYGTSVASLRQWNRIRGSVIKVGQRITILGARTLSTN